MQVPFFRPPIGMEEREAVDAVLRSGWLTTGKKTREFEAQFAAFLGTPHALAVNSCTAALHLALEAIGVQAGDAVLVPAMTFAATAAVVRYLGARPVLVDCEENTLCIAPERLRAAYRAASRESNVMAVIPVHYGGQMADMQDICEFAREAELPVIEDAAHAFPSWMQDVEDRWVPAGTVAQIGCYSFYANKCITTGEGGMLVTADEAVAQRTRMMSLHGLSKSAWSRYDAKGSWYYEIEEPGFKYNLTDVAAAIGLVQLSKAEQLLAERQRIAAAYNALFADYQDVLDLPVEQPRRRSSWHIYPIRLQLDRLDLSRDTFIDKLKEKGVGSSVHWMPLHLHPYYRRTYGYRAEDFPVAAREWVRLISLPIFPGMTREEQEHIASSVIQILHQHTRRQAFAATASGEREVQ
jgi:dTDP-4-amino-4,6-dideoxygalactose transaminase